MRDRNAENWRRLEGIEDTAKEKKRPPVSVNYRRRPSQNVSLTEFLSVNVEEVPKCGWLYSMRGQYQIAALPLERGNG